MWDVARLHFNLLLSVQKTKPHSLAAGGIPSRTAPRTADRVEFARVANVANCDKDNDDKVAVVVVGTLRFVPHPARDGLKSWVEIAVVAEGSNYVP
ncbi:hypothetical protein PX52LOC_06485 [Limnoglobus roseus]|uniref:Uncharacterized protein n=1 Tax=Limnoglobus roseus TaxID=2598579 RepID=A0A5C1AQF2_9BACT|nr:hypothetical protein PX52LOC_06485 [Limnoglobus roseus]